MTSSPKPHVLTLPTPVPPVPDAEQLAEQRAGLVRFAAASAVPGGGFGSLDAGGALELDRPAQTWITCRMTHVFALAHLQGGDPGGEVDTGAMVDHGVAALTGPLRDEEYGGWFADDTRRGSKEMYTHAFVVLAASSALAAGRPGARELLDDALAIVDRYFWQEDAGRVVDVWDRSFTVLDPYRGANANMHTVEALLSAADVTGNPLWRHRALQIAEHVVNVDARAAGWRLPEHFDAQWTFVPEYNTADRAHPFRPYGVTPGHMLEWARLCLHIRAALTAESPVTESPAVEALEWLLPAAVSLFDAAVRDGWSVDGAEGFVYTIDHQGVPVTRARMHWVVTEAIAAASALLRATGDERYADWYRLWWSYAERTLIDRERGSWHHELDEQNRPSGGTWSGKPDVYHAYQALLIPQLPLSPMLAPALAALARVGNDS